MKHFLNGLTAALAFIFIGGGIGYVTGGERMFYQIVEHGLIVFTAVFIFVGTAFFSLVGETERSEHV
jgi:hypothetical protein